jgi:hypothetical protein
MDINSLTIGEAKQLAAMFQQPAQAPAQPAHPFVGMYVICRGTWSGVHAGSLVSKDGPEVILRDARRLWSWKATKGVALSGLAQNGLASGKLDTMTPMHALSDVCECIPASLVAKESINAA